MNLQNYLGDNSYVAITQKLVNNINTCQPQTIRGKKLIEDLQVKLNESTTPMVEIKSFETNAKELSSEDATLADTLKLIKAENAAGDFNYLINLAKEEHIINERNSGNPRPEQILADIEQLFNDPSNVVIEAIRNNLFDEKLNSELYVNLKNDLTINPNAVNDFPKSTNKIKKLNESTQVNLSGLQKYNPIAIKYPEADRNIFITQFNALTVETLDDKPQFKPVEVKLPASYEKLALALGGVNYNYHEDRFETTNGLWDFDLAIDNTGKVLLMDDDGPIEIPVNDLSGLFIETIKHLNNSDDVKMKMSTEADRFNVIANNYNKLIKLDSLSVVSDDANYIMMDNDISKPELIANNLTNQLAFDSFNSMVEQLNESFKSDCSSVFNQQLVFEQELIDESYAVKQQLNENQQTLNKLIESTQKVIDIAEDGSPAQIEAENELKQLNESLKLNIDDLRETMSKPLY